MDWIVFDIDGVLIDVSESFDEAVMRTVSYFSDDLKHGLSSHHLKSLREKGVFGDDFELTETLITGLQIFDDPEELIQGFRDGEDIHWVREEWGTEGKDFELVSVFNSFYLGKNYEDRIFDFEGLWKKEKSMVRPERLSRLEKDHRVGVITGRDKLELELGEEIIGHEFKNYITRDDFIKPDPRALKALVDTESGAYVGDTLSDQRLVENYNSSYGSDLEFYMIGRDVDRTAELLDDMVRGFN